MARPLRVVAIGDFHCGHRAGLTPPAWWISPERCPKIAALQREMWRQYLRWIRQLGAPDVLLVNGDCIDGRGERSGGTELIESDRDGQCRMAVACIEAWATRGPIAMTRGTDYHTGQCEEFEDRIAHDVGAEIGNHLFPQVRGVLFDMKHHLGSSSVPHARHTAIARDRLWNVLWEDRQPRAHILLRSHVHYHTHAGGPDWLGMTLPALQAAATRFGGKRCSGAVDWGVTVFDISTRGDYTWRSHIVRLATEQQQVLKLA